MSKQSNIDHANSSFWNELCGTNKAKQLGVTDDSPESIARFHDWYMDYYWYLNNWIQFEQFAGKKVLEVGLGYGVILQEIVKTGADYRGLDIAKAPVDMGNYLIKMVNGTGECVVGNVLEAPFVDSEFDYVVSIGCLHHTGNFARALTELHRVVKSGGTVTLMVYYAYSFRRWGEMRKETLNQFMTEKLGIGDRVSVSQHERQRYDFDSNGNVAPETDFLSRADIKRLAGKIGFSAVEQGLELMGEGWLTRVMGRDSVLKIFAPA